MVVLFFFFQAGDGIRDYKVTGVQTCALPICGNEIRCATPPQSTQVIDSSTSTPRTLSMARVRSSGARRRRHGPRPPDQIGRASCRERVTKIENEAYRTGELRYSYDHEAKDVE